MTFREKQNALIRHCRSVACTKCPLRIKGKWSKSFADLDCPDVELSPTVDLDEALRIIGTITGDEVKPINPYWERITVIADRQRSKGLKEYGRGVEDDTANVDTRLDRIEEELIDALMYLEHLRDAIHTFREIIV